MLYLLVVLCVWVLLLDLLPPEPLRLSDPNLPQPAAAVDLQLDPVRVEPGRAGASGAALVGATAALALHLAGHHRRHRVNAQLVGTKSTTPFLGGEVRLKKSSTISNSVSLMIATEGTRETVVHHHPRLPGG